MITTEGGGEDGALRLYNSRIGDQLTLRGATVRNSAGPALPAEGLQTGGDLFLDEGFTAEGIGEQGTVRLVAARIGGGLLLRGATVRNPDGPALFADRLETHGNAVFSGGFTAEGVGKRGAVRLLGARIGDQLTLRGATLRNSAGPALYADGLQTHSNAVLDRGFTAEGVGKRGAVRLLGARIGGGLVLRGATVRNPDGPALFADRLQTHGNAVFDEGFSAEGVGNDGALRLHGALIGGLLILVGSTVPNSSDPLHRWVLDGLTCAGVPRLAREGNREAWLKLLRTGTPTYAAQPYQQLAAAYRAEGHDSDVRAILIAQRKDQIARGGLSRADRWWARITGVLLGYGYQPWRALLYLAAILALSVTFAVMHGAHGALARTPDRTPTVPSAAPPSASIPPAGPQPCALIERIGKGLDLGTPFLPRAATTRCETTATATGTALVVITWLLQVAAWALAVLFVAGFTGIVRKT